LRFESYKFASLLIASPPALFARKVATRGMSGSFWQPFCGSSVCQGDVLLVSECESFGTGCS